MAPPPESRGVGGEGLEGTTGFSLIDCCSRYQQHLGGMWTFLRSHCQLRHTPQTYSWLVRGRLHLETEGRGGALADIMGSARSYRGTVPLQKEVCEGRERKPASPSASYPQPPEPPDARLCNSGCSMVACGQAALVMDPHLLVKSLKMCPFPNRASKTRGSDSKPALKLHIRSQQETQTCPVRATPGRPKAFWVLRVHVKGPLKAANRKMGA